MKWVVIVSLMLMGLEFSMAAKRTSIKVDGSSTVFPITEAVSEEFGKGKKDVFVTVGMSGTGGGFKKFCAGEIHINNASRSIKASESKKCKAKKIDYKEFAVAYDGISVVVNKKNTWVDYLTVAELHKIWKPGSTVKTWKDVRSTWPAVKIKLYGPGTDSGTFDYFTHAINGKSQASRSNFTKSEDDNVLVKGVQGDKNSLGYFGFAYYIANKSRVKIVPIKTTKKAKAIEPTLVTINNGSYKPLSRPIFIYVNMNAVKKEAPVKSFVQFYMKNAGELSKSVGYVPLTAKQYKDSLKSVQ